MFYEGSPLQTFYRDLFNAGNHACYFKSKYISEKVVCVCLKKESHYLSVCLSVCLYLPTFLERKREKHRSVASCTRLDRGLNPTTFWYTDDTLTNRTTLAWACSFYYYLLLDSIKVVHYIH